MIHQTFQEATKARGARKIEIINLGLEPWEAIEMGLEVNSVGHVRDLLFCAQLLFVAAIDGWGRAMLRMVP